MSLPPKFIERLHERKVIPFVGAGVPMNVTDKSGNTLFPDWRNLLLTSADKLRDTGKEAAAKLVEGNLEITPPNYLEAARTAQKYLGSEFYDLIQEKISIKSENADENSLRIPQIIWEISHNLIITTNYDKVLSWTCPNIRDLSRWNIEAPKEQADLIRTQFVQNPTVWHLHGHIDDVRNIILTPDGYEKLYPTNTNSKIKYDAALRTLEILFISHTFLFIGFSLDDEYFVNQLRYVQNLFQGTSGKHYVLIRETEQAKLNSLNLGIEPITFESFGERMFQKFEDIKAETVKGEDRVLTATQKYNPQNRVVHIPFNQKGAQVVGRAENLKNVREKLLQGVPTNIGQAVSIQGLGGLGKTQLAVEYAYEYEKEYLNGVIWLTVDQDIDKQLVEVCDAGEWVAPRSEIKVKLDIARHRLKTITDCLIVLDNVKDFDEKIKEYLPAPRKDIHILATSRKLLYGFEPFALEFLTPEQAVQMLEQESHRKASDENEKATIMKIAEEVDFLPLALEHIGGFLHYLPKYSWEKFLLFLRDNPRKAFEGKFLEGSFTEHKIDVYRTLKVSESILNEEPLLRDVLDLLTWSGSSAMGVDLMCRLLDKKDYELEKALSLGETLRLLSKSLERNAYAFHRLVAEVRKEDIPLAKRVDWISNICQLLGDWFQDIRDDFFNKLPEYEAELEHLLTWQQYAKDFSPANASRLLWLQVYLPYYRGEYKTAIKIVANALEIYKYTKTENQEILANLYNDFGSLSGELGNYQEQFDNHKKSLEIRLDLFGEKHADTASSFNNIGLAYGNLGKYQKQFDNYKKSLDIRLELYGEKHLETASSFHNIGAAYRDLGKYQEQFDNYKKSLEICLELYGEIHPSTASFFNSVGGAYRDLGKDEEGFDYLKKSLDIRLELYGENHPKTANSLYNLSFYYQEQNNYETAIEYAEKSFVIHRNILGNLHSNTIDSVLQLTNIYTEDKKGDKALRLINEFLIIAPKSNPKHKELENQKRWILSQTQKKGFRQQSVNPVKQKRKKKRR